MSERIVSPGTFINENDQSYLPVGVGAIGAAFVGPTSQGPAFVPTEVTSYQDFIDKFGGSYNGSYVPYAVKNYLQYAGSATVVRVVETIGYTAPKLLYVVTGSTIIGALHQTSVSWNNGNASGFSTTITSSATLSDLRMIVSASSGTNTTVTASFNPIAPNWYGNQLSTNAVSSKNAFHYVLFKNQASASYAANTTGSLSVISAAATDLVLSGSGQAEGDYSPASTPWITSQTSNGSSIELFRIHTISHGSDMNRKFKVGILNIKRAGEVPGSDYGSFSLIVRKYDDTDKSQNIIEQYENLTLDPDSTNYIGKQIGDIAYTWDDTNKKLFKTGNFKNVSKYIRVEISADVDNKAIPATMIPYGYAQIETPVKHTVYSVPAATLITTQELNSAYNNKVYYGFSYDFTNTDNINYLNPIPKLSGAANSNTAFNLDSYFVHASASSGAGVSLSSSLAPITARKFVVPMQGGFDCFNPAVEKLTGSSITATNMQGLDLQYATSEGSLGYDRAARLLANQDIYDMKLVFTPGVIYKHHASVVEKFIDLCETRGDAFYVFDAAQLQARLSMESVVDYVDGVDTSYAATYYPWCRIKDTDLNKDVWVPASVVIPGAYAFSDKIGYEWFAPAGLNRGAMGNVTDVYVSLDHADRDTLYEGRVNPIATFPNEGIVVWGQKTLQVKPSALDRINVRRLLINLKKFIASTTKYVVFEQNTSATRNKFLALVNPYMENVQQKSGLYAFKVQMDENNNTADIIDRNILKGEIFIQPAKTSEFVLISLNVTPTGANFAD